MGLFIKELYEVAEQHQHEPEAAANAKTSKESQWEALQKIAFDTTPNAYEIFSGFVYTAQKQSVRLPVVKKAVEDCKFVGANGRLINITKDATVVCDIVSNLFGA